MKPGNSGYNVQDSPSQSNIDGITLEYLLSNKKNKKRNHLINSCYVGSCDFQDPYDNTKVLPIGKHLKQRLAKGIFLICIACYIVESFSLDGVNVCGL